MPDNGEELTNKRNTGRESHQLTTYSTVPVAEPEPGTKDPEKPWKRVVSLITRKGTHLYEPVKSVPSTLLIVLLGVLLLLGFLTQLVEDEQPNPVAEADLSRTDVDKFCEERSWRYIHRILGNQSRVCGTRHHLQKTIELKDLVDSIATSASWNVRTDWQMLTGDFWANYAASHVSYYQNVSNVIALLEGDSGLNPDGTTRSTILVNCHYDSVPFALGTSDDMVFCGVMLETFSLLSRQPSKFKHNILFLWNGAEENSLQGSHAFLSHPWFQGVTSVVNLDSAGMNGKASVFQVTDTRLLNAYAKTARRPCAQGLGEVLFASGAIPSDTDFRNWRYYGNLHGIDIAFVKWGHVYHTRYDHPDFVMPGVVQNSGDMLLGLVKELGDMDELSVKMTEPTLPVYWDYLYVFLASYTYTGAHVLDTFVLLFALASIGYYVWVIGFKTPTYVELGLSVAGRLVCVAAGMVVVFTLTPIVIATTVQLRYLTQPWIIVPLYWIPYLVGAVAASQYLDAWRAKKSGLNRSLRACQAMAATRLILCLVMFILLCIPSLVAARYVITVPLFLMSFAAFVSLTVLRIWRLQAWHHLLLEFLLSLPSTMFLFSIALRMNSLLVPIMGRNHSDDPDWTIALVNAMLAVFVSSTLSGVELLFSRKRLWIAISALMAGCIIIMFIPMNPYSDDGPAVQRHYWFHSEIISYSYNGDVTDRVSGVLVTKHDAYTPQSVLPVLSERNFRLDSRTEFSEDCQNFVYCNLPLYRTKFNTTLDQSIFLYMSPPTGIQSSLTLTRKSCEGQSCVLEFTLMGPPHNMITLWPLPNAELTAWSFQSPLISSFRQNDRSVYVVFHSHATFSDVFGPLQFTLTIAAPSSMHSQPLIDISHHAHKIDHPEDYTAAYRSLVNAMPAYFNIASFLSIRSNYIF